MYTRFDIVLALHAIRRQSLVAIVGITASGLIIGHALDARAFMVTNPSFETDEPTSIFGFPGAPSSFGDWGGDQSEIVTAENGVTPVDGIRMLRFDATGNSADPALNTAQVYQTIDVSSFATEIAQGIAQVSISASFNRVAGDSQTDTSMAALVYAFAGGPASLQSQLVARSWLDNAGASVGTDGDPSTWEMVGTSLLLPAGTDFLGIRLSATENIFVDGTYPEFDGHYVDDISVVMAIIPEPSTLLLLGVGTLMLLLRRR